MRFTIVVLEWSYLNSQVVTHTVTVYQKGNNQMINIHVMDEFAFRFSYVNVVISRQQIIITHDRKLTKIQPKGHAFSLEKHAVMEKIDIHYLRGVFQLL